MSATLNHRLTRRTLIRSIPLFGAAAVASACAQPAASPTSAPTAKPAAAPTSQPAAAPPTTAPAQAQPSVAATSEWDKLVATATSEKTLNLATYAGTGYRKVVEAFQTAFPGISVEHSQFQSSSREFSPRVLAEIKAGLHGFDVAAMPPQEMLRQIRPAGGIDPVRPKIIHPDALAEKNWVDGFEGGFYDNDKKWGYALSIAKSEELWINTDEVKESDIKSITDLLDPKWKGKMVGGDPRTKGSGFNSATVMRLKQHDDDMIKKLYVDQEMVIGTDARQLTEFMVRGRYIVGIGAVDEVILKDFVDQGMGKNLKSMPLADIDYVYANSSVAWLMKEAPHPNAAALFINWLLTKEGATIWTNNIGDNSRRVDVPPAQPDRVPVPGVEYIHLQAESFLDELQKTQDIAKSVLN